MPSHTTLPVIVVSGFLGSGKTTLINRWVQEPGMARTLVIINEFGDIDLDHPLRAHARGEDTPTTLTLTGGCICCTLEKDLLHTLKDALWRFAREGTPQFDRILIETTGVANPAPIVHTLASDARLARKLHFEGTLVTVDGAHAARSLSAYPDASAQLASADLVLTTKADVITASEQNALARLVRAHSPHAPMLDARDTEGATVLERLTQAVKVEAPLTFTVPGTMSQPSSLLTPSMAPAHTERFEVHRIHIEQAEHLSAESLEQAIDELTNDAGEEIVRFKARLKSRTGRCVYSQGLHHSRAPTRTTSTESAGDEGLELLLIAHRPASPTLKSALMRLAKRLEG
ncbi:CobW family GTP-binding protein [Larsenimonas salina]|uniref:CobW family GTP-binding protein n=1 Tax=Larsenimonas salina TaxID=1295565 RepID=UPI002072E8BA|nr:GTP-binding protein [Larsenimonas salina]MCM5703320.1 GTP-binding protein [Larsenimonas salina]